jgi:hypothetical protein
MPNTREKLIELLRDFDGICVCGLDCEGCRWKDDEECEVKARADHLIANGVTVQEWISVKDRLPEYEEPVMGWDAEMRDMGIVNFIYGQFFDILDMSETNVTHWMPLPQPPKGE